MMKKDMESTSFKSGFTAIIGAPNVGKSTLLNRILEDKIAIVSPRPQTTRNRILGVLHRPQSQIIFLDTPGIHKSEKALNRKMVETAIAAISDVEIILVMIDAAKPDPASESLLLEKLPGNRRKPVILAINKIDKVKKPDLLQLIDHWSKAYPFAEIVPISAAEGAQVPELINLLENLLPQGPPYFPEDMITDMPERFVAAEMIREKIFALTGQEIPFSTAVTIESFVEESDRDMVRIHAVIHVERESQKGIIIGKGGAMLKAVGQAARIEIERMVGMKVFLKLFVRVEKNWSNDARALRRLGYS